MSFFPTPPSHGRSPEVQGFPPPFALQPFIADRLRSINVVGKGKRPLCPATVAETGATRRHKPGVLPVDVMEAGARFTFAHMTHSVLDVGIVPLSVQIMKSCSGAPRPLEDQGQASLKDSPRVTSFTLDGLCVSRRPS